MKMESSFKNLPIVHKIFYLAMMVGMPVAMTLLFLVLLLVVKVEEFMFLALPLIFGIVSPVMILKDLLNPEKIQVGEKKVVMEKRFGKGKEIDLKNIKAVINLVTKDRIVILLLSNDPSKIISVTDWYPQDKKKELISHLKKIEQDLDLNIKEFQDKPAAMAYARSFYA